MSTERELKDHIWSLEDRLDWFGLIEDQIAELKDGTDERFDNIGSMVNKLIDKINELVSAQNNVGAKLDEAVNNSFGSTKQTAPSPFEEIMRNARTPKRQKFKPKVVSDQPDGPGAA